MEVCVVLTTSTSDRSHFKSSRIYAMSILQPSLKKTAVNKLGKKMSIKFVVMQKKRLFLERQDLSALLIQCHTNTYQQ